MDNNLVRKVLFELVLFPSNSASSAANPLYGSLVKAVPSAVTQLYCQFETEPPP
jgi:hypothetical protein